MTGIGDTGRRKHPSIATLRATLFAKEGYRVILTEFNILQRGNIILDFALRYAVKEIKKRPLDFLPILLSALGVFILIFNMIIYFESQRVTNISYYRLDFEIKLYEMPHNSIAYIESLPYVKSVKSVTDEINSNTLYIAFNPPHNESANAIFKAFDRLIDDINLRQYPYYQTWERDIGGFNRNTFKMPYNRWFNAFYIDALLENPMFSPPMLVLMFTSSILMSAVMILVFSLKLKKNINEYAMLRSLGMTTFDIMKINMFQGMGILLLSTPIAFVTSAVTMKLVCEASHNLYPEVRDNTPLIYNLPVQYIIIAVLIITAVSSVSLLLVCKLYNRKTIVGLISGAELLKISFVEKSSDKFEKARDFSHYGKLYRKRTRKSLLSTNIAYVAMLIFPLIFVYAIFWFLNNYLYDFTSTAPKIAYSISLPFNIQDSSGIMIPESMVNEIKAIEGVSGISRSTGSVYLDFIYELPADCYITDKHNNRHPVSLWEYGRDIDKNHLVGQELFNLSDIEVISGNIDDLDNGRTVAVFEYTGLSVGDEVTVQNGRYTTQATVAAVLKNSKQAVYTVKKWASEPINENDYTEETHSLVFYGLETMRALYKLEEVFFTSDISIFTEKGYEEEIIRQVEYIAEIDNNFESIYEQQQYSHSLIGTNRYLMRSKQNIKNIFTCIFLAAQVIFLFVSSAFIISAINNFNINKRRREFAIIRALGEERVNIIKTIKTTAVINAVVIAAAAIFVTFIFIIFIDTAQFATFKQTVKYLFDYYIKSYFVYIFTFGFMICVNLFSSLNAAKKTTGDSLINDIRKF